MTSSGYAIYQYCGRIIINVYFYEKKKKNEPGGTNIKRNKTKKAAVPWGHQLFFAVKCSASK